MLKTKVNTMQRAENAGNKCEGCKNWWPFDSHRPWPRGSEEMRFHTVKRGDKVEIVFCTNQK